MTRENRWSEMAQLITPEILSTIAVVGEPATAARLIWERYGDFVDDLALASDVVPAATLGEMAGHHPAVCGAGQRARPPA